MPKDKDRTEEQLAGAAQGLQEIAWMLNSHGVKWFLACGALLGASRDGDLILWDWDIDIEIDRDTLQPTWQTVVKDMEKAGFFAEEMLHKKKISKIRGKKYGMTYALRVWSYDTDDGYYKMRRPECKLPASLFGDTGRIELRGVVYPCPADTEGYLEWIYGDWRTVIRETNYRHYTTDQFTPRGRIKTGTGQNMR